MLNGYKFRLYPDDAQARVLLGWIGCQRLIYNAKVQEDRYFRRFARRMVGTAGESIPVDQQYSQFITERTAFLRDVPSQVLRNGAVKFRQAYARFFKQLGGRPKFKKRGGRQAVWLTGELFQFLPVENLRNDAANGYQLVVGTPQCPVGVLRYRAHRPHALPASIHRSVDGGLGGCPLLRTIAPSRSPEPTPMRRRSGLPRICDTCPQLNVRPAPSAETAASPSRSRPPTARCMT